MVSVNPDPDGKFRMAYKVPGSSIRIEEYVDPEIMDTEMYVLHAEDDAETACIGLSPEEVRSLKRVYMGLK